MNNHYVFVFPSSPPHITDHHRRDWLLRQLHNARPPHPEQAGTIRRDVLQLRLRLPRRLRLQRGDSPALLLLRFSRPESTGQLQRVEIHRHQRLLGVGGVLIRGAGVQYRQFRPL